MAEPLNDAPGSISSGYGWPPPEGEATAPWLRPAAKPRRGRLVLPLIVVATVLLVAVAVLAGLLISAHRDAADAASAEAAEDEQQAKDVAIAEQIVAESEQALAEAEAAAIDGAARADAAEARQGEAEAAAEPTDADLAQFLWLLRDSDPEFATVPDASLIDFGQVTCDYLDTFGNSDQTVARAVSIGVASGLTSRQAAAVTGAAMVVLCPQHKLD